MKIRILKNSFLKKGQVLLVIIMLLATSLTIALAVTFKSTTDTQLSQLEADSQRALAAAEAGIEAAIRQGNVNLNTLNLGVGISGAATIDAVTNKKEFVSPLLQKDEQYTFYLSDYDKDTGTFSSSYAGGDMTIYFGQGNCPTLELTVVNTTGTTINRHLLKPSCETTIAGTSSFSVTSASGETVDGATLTYKATVPVANLSGRNVLFLRVLSSSSSIATPIGVKVGSSFTLPVQGSTITSQATTASGVTKRVRLFQSYPQIPAEFFVTQF